MVCNEKNVPIISIYLKRRPIENSGQCCQRKGFIQSFHKTDIESSGEECELKAFLSSLR